MAARIGILEAFGLSPASEVLAAARRTIVGSPYVPKSRFGLSSTRIFKPWISLPTWLGRKRADRLVPIYNFVNRVPQPKDDGYSVRVTYARDYRGGQWTYDGHLGTDFACSIGTPIVAAAPGWIVRIENQLDQGGLKVCVDHGEGLFTTHNHLSRALVHVGERVDRGQALGLSGASGLEFALFFPWVSPHLHYNVWLDGDVADPFARPDEISLWRRRNAPVPHDGTQVVDDATVKPTAWDRDAVDEAIAACRDPQLADYVRALPTLAEQAAAVLVRRMYRPTLFSASPALSRERFGRRPRLDLPFRRDDFDGALHPPA
jgi:murein DD-endopeptidase MepM/ murein hydrolase activator NlpD